MEIGHSKTNKTPIGILREGTCLASFCWKTNEDLEDVEDT